MRHFLTKDVANNAITLITRGNYLFASFIINSSRTLHGQMVIGWMDINQCRSQVTSWSNLNYQSVRNKSTKEQASTITKVKEPGQLDVAQKVKQATKDVSYLGIFIVGIGITGIMFYTIFRELFSGRSPNVVYGKTLTRCKEDTRIINACGEPIKGYGETTSRGRRRHVSHMEYIQDGVNYMRMKFYIEGSRRKGTVHLEMKENDKGKYEYRYLFVELQGYPRETIILEDNRHTVLSDI